MSDDDLVLGLASLWRRYTQGQLKRDLAHKLRPRLPDCRFGFMFDERQMGMREWCIAHEHWRLECEKYALGEGM